MTPTPDILSLFSLLARTGIVIAVLGVSYYAYWKYHPSNSD